MNMFDSEVARQRQVRWTRLGITMGGTDTEPKRARIWAAVAALVWVEPEQVSDVLHAAPVRFLVAGLFQGQAWELQRAAVAALPAADRLPLGARMVGLESVTGDRYVLLENGHEAIDILHDSAPVVAATGDQHSAESAARHLYEAEVALHEAHQSHVDAWIAVAADRLHGVVVEHLRAVEAAQHGSAR
jgi:hypothetical protein